MQFVNGITLICISFLKLAQCKSLFYKLGDNKCIDLVEAGDVTELKNYLRESIFCRDKRKLDIEVFFWVLWSNFKVKIQNMKLEEEREAVLDEIRVFGFKSNFVQCVRVLKQNVGILGQEGDRKFEDSDVYKLVRSLQEYCTMRDCIGFLFKLAIDELKLPISLFSKLKIGEKPSQSYTLYKNLLTFDENSDFSSKLAVVVVDVSSEENFSSKEYILAFGAIVGPGLANNTSKIDNFIGIPNQEVNYYEDQLDNSIMEIMQVKDKIDSKKNVLATGMKKIQQSRKSNNNNNKHQKAFLDSLPIVQEHIYSEEEASRFYSTNYNKVTIAKSGGLVTNNEDNKEDSEESMNFDEVNLSDSQSSKNQKHKDKSDNSSEIIEIEVEQILTNLSSIMDAESNIPFQEVNLQLGVNYKEDSHAQAYNQKKTEKLNEKNDELQMLILKNEQASKRVQSKEI